MVKRITGISKHANDLRDCGSLNSERPVPDYVYSFICVRDSDDDFTGERVRPHPFCRFRFAKQLRGFLERAYPDVDPSVSRLASIVGYYAPDPYRRDGRFMYGYVDVETGELLPGDPVCC